jgi:predicted MFS family arabinose efflux permease
MKSIYGLPPSTYLLALAQSINLTAAVLSVTVSALVGIRLAPNEVWGTAPYGFQFAMVMLCTYPASLLMRRYGRKTGFVFGALLLFLSGCLGYVSVSNQNFEGLILAHGTLGIYIAFANFYRFAAVDNISGESKAKAISMVVSGGILAAILGPLLSMFLRDVSGFVEFSLCYAALSGLGFLTFFILHFWKPNNSKESDAKKPLGSRISLRGHELALLGIFASSIGYFAMNLFMVQASLVMRSICSFNASSFAIQGHVIAMFLPSLFANRLISQLGIRHVLTMGFSLMALATVISISFFLEYDKVFIGLLLVGLGWNFTYVGGSALIAEKIPPEQRHLWQGVNDTVIAVCATLGAFLPAPLLSALGWQGSNVLSMVLCCFAGIVCWVIFGRFDKPHPIGVSDVQ